jgi:hypothetical protein
MGPNEPVSLKGGTDTRLRVSVTGVRPRQVKHYSLSAQQLASTLLASLDDIQTRCCLVSALNSNYWGLLENLLHLMADFCHLLDVSITAVLTGTRFTGGW